MQQETHFQICGMSQDLAYQLFNPKYAFECKNIRINTTDENSLLSLSNERGNALVKTIDNSVLEETGRDIQILGVGQFSEYCVLFGKDRNNPPIVLPEEESSETENNEAEEEAETEEQTEETSTSNNNTNTSNNSNINIGNDFIFLMNTEIVEGVEQVNVRKIYQGDLGFQLDHPIKTVCVYENEDVQKVYWIDGINVPRVINVAGELTETSTIKHISEQKINFLPKLQFKEHVSVTPSFGGKFNAGVIQYAFTYSDRHLQESNIWYVSPLYCITSGGRGLAAGETCNTAFRIDFTNLDTSFDYVQIYAILRTSLNATPQCFKIPNLQVQQNLSFIDTGALWESCSWEDVLYKQLSTFVPKVITTKDSVLFLGNYTLPPNVLEKSTYESYFNAVADSLTVVAGSSESNVDDMSSYQTFRSGEYYRIGIQFQDEYGTPTNVIMLKDIQIPIVPEGSTILGQKLLNCNLTPVIPSNNETTTEIQTEVQSENTEEEEEEEDEPIQYIEIPAKLKAKYKRARLVMVDRSTVTHRTLGQGILCPTVYRLKDRMTNSPFAISSWNMRGIKYHNHEALPSCLTVAEGEVENQAAQPTITTDYINDTFITFPHSIVQIEASQEQETPQEQEEQEQEEQEVQAAPTAQKWYVYARVMMYASAVGNTDDRALKIAILVRISNQFHADGWLPDIANNRDYATAEENAIWEDETIATAIIEDEWLINIFPEYKGYYYDNNSRKIVGAYPSNIEIREWLYSCLVKGLASVKNKDGWYHLNTPKRKTPDRGIVNILHPELVASQLVNEIADVDPIVLTAFRYRKAAMYMGIPILGGSARRENRVDAGEFTSVDTGAVVFDQIVSIDTLDDLSTIDNQFYSDHNILTFHSPDVEYYQSIIDNNPNVKYRIVGYTNMQRSKLSKVLTATPPANTAVLDAGIQNISLTAATSIAGVYNVPLWLDDKLYQTYIWHRGMSLGKQQYATEDGKWYGQYTKKIMANKRLCGDSAIFPGYPDGIIPRDTLPIGEELIAHPAIFPAMGTPRVFNSEESSALAVATPSNFPARESILYYYGNVEMMHGDEPYYVPYNSDGHIELDTNSGQINDPCPIMYKSTPHIVMPMKFILAEDDTFKGIYATSLPSVAGEFSLVKPGKHYMNTWNIGEHGFLFPSLTVGGKDLGDIDASENCFYLAELYQDIDAIDIYGPVQEDLLARSTWIPISDWEPVTDLQSLTGYGDCFIGRWECLKTYASTDSDYQSYIDVTSFVVESNTNLASRYDKQQDLEDIVYVNPQEFGLFNPVYNQQNNLFTYRALTEREFLTQFQNQICWSEEKTLGEESDTWCQINVGNNIDLMGEYGKLEAMTAFGGSIICLQDSAVHKVNYNTRITISPSDGVPIQLANNRKVDSPILLKADCGTQDSDFIITSESYLYFLDWYKKSIYQLDTQGNIVNYSKTKGMHSILSKLGSPKKLFYDSAVNDIYFNFSQNTLAANDDLMEFTSLYDYTNTEFLFSLQGNTYVTNKNKIYKQRSGKYNHFFGEYKPYYIELLANNDALKSKTFTNVEFTMDSTALEQGASTLNKEVAFNQINAQTSYQEGQEALSFNRYLPSNLKRKFRLWRVNIPRDYTRKLDRMRDTWCRIKLTKNPVLTNDVALDTNNNVKTRVNNINISYLPD